VLFVPTDLCQVVFNMSFIMAVKCTLGNLLGLMILNSGPDIGCRTALPLSTPRPHRGFDFSTCDRASLASGDLQTTMREIGFFVSRA
jgi:hypothetical protein